MRVSGVQPRTDASLRLYATLSSSLPPFHISIISHFARSDPISHIPDSLLAHCLHLPRLSSPIVRSRWVSLLAGRCPSAALLACFLFARKTQRMKNNALCSSRVLNARSDLIDVFLITRMFAACGCRMRACMHISAFVTPY